MPENNSQQGPGMPTGTKIGKYEVRKRLGIGGQAVVYKCYDPTLDRNVAIKQVPMQLAADEESLKRFRKEAQILAKLAPEQPGIVNIYELLETEQGQFIVMEFVAGHTLEQSLEENRQPVDPKATLQIIWRLAAALNAVHSAGIIHRDIKPGNIIVGEGLRAKITDFGVAATLTGQESLPLGTTKYMAPELFAGTDIDERVDVYSLGFIAYEMLIGRDKFNEIFQDIVRDRHSEALRWMKWHGNEKVQAPPAHEINPSVPKPLSDIVSKMMAKDRDQRFENMEILGRAIRSAFSGHARGTQAGPVGGPPEEMQPQEQPGEQPAGGEGEEAAEEAREPQGPPPTAPVPSKGLSRRTKLVLLGVIVVSIIGIGVSWGVKQHMEATNLRKTATQAFEEAKDDFEKALEARDIGQKDQAIEKLREAIAGFQDLTTKQRFKGTIQSAKASVWVHLCRGHINVLRGNWSAAAAEESNATERIQQLQARSENQLFVEWTTRMDNVIRDFEEYRLNTRDFEDKIQTAENALEEERFAEAEDNLEYLSNLTLTSLQRQRLRQLRAEATQKKFEKQFKEHVSKGDEMLGQDDYVAARTAYQDALAMLESETARELSATRRNQLQKTVEEKIEKLDRESRYAAAMSEARQAEQNNDTAARIEALEKANNIKPSAELENQISRLKSEMSLTSARRLYDENKYDQALKELEKILADNPDNSAAKSLRNRIIREQDFAGLLRRADGLHNKGQWEQALELYQQAAKIKSDSSLKDKIKDCRSRIKINEGRKHRANGDYKEAITAFEQARSIDPSKKELVTAELARTTRERKYKSYLSQAKTALENREFANAKELVKQARDINDTKETQALSDEIHYEENLQKGREAMNANDYKGAIAYFNIAKRYKDTDEVKSLIAQARQQLEQ